MHKWGRHEITNLTSWALITECQAESNVVILIWKINKEDSSLLILFDIWVVLQFPVANIQYWRITRIFIGIRINRWNVIFVVKFSLSMWDLLYRMPSCSLHERLSQLCYRTLLYLKDETCPTLFIFNFGVLYEKKSDNLKQKNYLGYDRKNVRCG